MSFQDYVAECRVRLYEDLRSVRSQATGQPDDDAGAAVDATLGNRDWLADRRQEWRRLYGRKAA